jgi:hypothetical protein
VPTLGVPLALLSVVFEWAWFILVGRGLLRLSSAGPADRQPGGDGLS